MAKRKPKARADGIAPPKVRWDRGEVEQLPRAIADHAGNAGQPYRAIDTLELMARHGTINEEMRKAGEIFRDDFARAALDPLRAADPTRLRVDGLAGEIQVGSHAAGSRVWKALKALGGLTSPAGACAWAVLGEQKGLENWAKEGGWRARPIDYRVAQGVFIGTLAVLAAHFGLDRPCRPS